MITGLIDEPRSTPDHQRRRLGLAEATRLPVIGKEIAFNATLLKRSAHVSWATDTMTLQVICDRLAHDEEQST